MALCPQAQDWWSPALSVASVPRSVRGPGALCPESCLWTRGPRVYCHHPGAGPRAGGPASPTPSPTQRLFLEWVAFPPGLVRLGETETALENAGLRATEIRPGTLWGPRNVCLLFSGNGSGAEGTEVWGALG